MKKVKVDELASTLEKELTLYHQEINEEVKKAARRNISKMRNETKQQQYKNKGTEYRDAIATKKVEENVNSLIMAWYVKPPHYRLSHLLEWGHQTPDGGRTIAYGTITKAENNAVETYLKEVEEIVSDK